MVATTTTLRVGDIAVSALSDGTIRLPPGFYVNLDFEAHADMLAPDGNVHVPIGCYLLRTGDRTVLVDAGMGPVTNRWGEGGGLPAALTAAGASPEDVDTVVCTHLHLDHAGWLVHEDAPWFPNATVRYGTGDWEQFVAGAPPEDRIRRAMEVLRDAGRLEPLDGDMVGIAPGVTARHTPGHTLGHYGIVLSSGEARAYLLGDAVECPLQLEEPDLSVMSDVDPGLAARTRESIWREVEGSADLVGAAHFPGLQLGRVLTGTGRRWVGV